MITIQSAVEEIVSKSPYLETALVDGIVNSSALARQIKKEIENRSLKDVHEGAIITAINRLASELKKRQNVIKPILKYFGDISVKSNLVELTFVNSSTLIERQRRLLEKVSTEKGIFLTFTQSLYQATIIISAVFQNEVKKIFAEEKLISNISNLSAITLTLSEETVNVPGVYYYILKILAWYGVNIIEVVSSFTECTLILEDKNIDRAFSLLKNLSS